MIKNGEKAQIKSGDIVKAHDLSYSMYINSDGQLASYDEIHDSMMIDSPFNLATAYRVIATGVEGLPSYSVIRKESHFVPNNTIVQDIKNNEIIFIDNAYLYPVKVCPECGYVQY